MEDYNGFKVEIKLVNVQDDDYYSLKDLLLEFEDELERMVELNFKGRLASFGGKGEYIKFKEVK